MHFFMRQIGTKGEKYRLKRDLFIESVCFTCPEASVHTEINLVIVGTNSFF